jgi:hypothetical protein
MRRMQIRATSSRSPRFRQPRPPPLAERLLDRAALAGAVASPRSWRRSGFGVPAARSDRAGDARIQFVTDFDGIDQAAAISRDGRVAAFLSDRDGRTDVWVTRLGSGQFRNLTSGAELELINPSVRTLGFTPDGESVTYWVRRPGANGRPISASD